jgi:hypothetical protein
MPALHGLHGARGRPAHRDEQEHPGLYHEIVPFDPAEAQALSDKAVDILRAIAAEELPPRIASAPDFYLCRMCPYARRCWESNA